MRKAVIYPHGQGGSADEALRYKPLFQIYQVTGMQFSHTLAEQIEGKLKAGFA